MKSVSNPLTIIALFAALAEIAGTVAIKLVAPEMQPTFIWFVMLFPTLIVVFFFVTLNFNAKVLYAPGDFRDEQNYLAVVNAKQGLAIDTFQTMLGEAIPEIVNGVTKAVSANGADDKRKIEEVVQTHLSPVQSFADRVRADRESDAYLGADNIGDDFRKRMWAVRRLLSAEPKPVTIEEIESKLKLEDFEVSLLLLFLANKGLVKAHPDKGNGVTYSAAVPPHIELGTAIIEHYRKH